MTSHSKDYRLKENRREYFTALYQMNLKYGVMPGLVYLYMPELAKRYGWDIEQRLWFAFLNGNTQNPITSRIIMNQFPEIPKTTGEMKQLAAWFDREWVNLSFDIDRRYQKKELPSAVWTYGKLVEEYGSQEKLLTGSFADLWERVTGSFHAFGRLSAFSYLEYVRIMGAGAGCDRLFLEDKSGSKSHRNGMFFLLGMDDMVWDKRHPETHDGNYHDFKKMCAWLENQATDYLNSCGVDHADLGFFTFESQCCQFKNGFFRRRYPGVYSDMAWERIKWYADRGMDEHTRVFRQIREDRLPDWLRAECGDPVGKREASLFADTGVPFRAEHFLET